MNRILPILTACAIAFMPAVTKQRLAVRELSQRASSGDAKALYDLAMLHDSGYDSIAVDSARSTALYRMAAEHGYAPAQNYLGFRYFNGEAVEENVDSALYWMGKAAAGGDAKAANNLGYLLAYSDKVTHDYPQAIYWLSKAADAGLPAGMTQLADLLRQGAPVTPENPTPSPRPSSADTLRAEQLYMKAIQAGLHDAELKLLGMKGHCWETLSPDSLLSLGKYHYTHHAPLIGVTLLENVVNNTSERDSATLATALAILGDAYSRGVGVGYDHDRSVALYKEAALLGNPSAQFVIAELLEIFPDALDDPGNPDTEQTAPLTPHEKTARYWYEQAAREGVTDAETATSRLFQ